MEKQIFALIIPFVIWFVAKTVMKNEYKKNIKFLFFIKKLETSDEKILSVIFSIISILAGLSVFILK
ncbi:MAG: hypothetical protein M0R46_04290 [Candidatus Muirbacterium halophilum]|nr:hypothetical protein [Candidatus Muirbacterium halophilum]MCK9475113.1 hypothetical protein [Candidatus Muirbacterium halophilum]